MLDVNELENSFLPHENVHCHRGTCFIHTMATKKPFYRNPGPPHVKSWLTGKDPNAGRDWGQEEKGTTKDEMAGWHHRLDGHEFE